MLLFEAPLDFDPAIWQAYQSWMPLTADPEKVTVLVCDPLGGEIGESHLRAFPNLKVLATPSTGTDHIDLEACQRVGVKVVSLLDDRPGLDTISASAEFTFKLLLDAFRLAPAQELQGKAIGLTGYGRIGKRLMHWLSAFGASARVHDPKYKGLSLPLAEVFRTCDGAVICCSLTPETRGMITGPILRSMKTNAVLVNTARGEILDEEALVWVMRERPDLRVALDVVSGETDGTANPERLKRLGAIVTPHIAGATLESRTKAARVILDLLRKELL